MDFYDALDQVIDLLRRSGYSSNAGTKFRSRIDMTRYRFGEGEYKYFADPLPPLVRHQYFDTGPIDLRAEQGYEIGRRSQLYLRAYNKESNIEVSVGGKVVMTARGEFV